MSGQHRVEAPGQPIRTDDPGERSLLDLSPEPTLLEVEEEALSEPKPAGPSLGRAAGRGVLVTLGGQWGRTLIQTISTVVLGRLLLKQDFGLLAEVTVIVGVADLLRDFGLSAAMVQARKIDDALWAQLWWMSLAIGAGLATLVACCSPLVAHMYAEPRLTVLMVVLSPGLLVNAACMPLQARAQRDLRFGMLAKIDILSMLLSVVAAVGTAALGWGVWSLVLMTGVAAVYRLIALVLAVRPQVGRPRISREVRPLLSFGANMFGVQLLIYVSRNLDNVVVGRYGGAAELGVYSRAYNLMLLPLSQLNGPLARVALPVLSRLQDDAQRYRKYISSALLVIGYLSGPVFAVAAAVAVPLFRVLLGPQWSQAGQVFSILAIAGLAQAFSNPQGWLYTTLGRARAQLIYFIWTRPFILGSFFVGYFAGGISGLALAYGTVTVLLLVPGFASAIRGTFVTAADILRPIWRPLILVPPIFGASWWGAHAYRLPDAVHLVAGGAAGLVVFALFQLIPAYRADVRDLLTLVKTMRKGG